MNTMKEILSKAYQFRYACKKFDPNKLISDEDFHTILETGRLSPSSWGFEPWKFLVIQNEDLKKALFPIAWGAQNSLNGASHFVIILARKKADMQAGSDYTRHMMRDVHHLPENIMQGQEKAYGKWQTGDFNLLENERTAFDWSCKQTYIALGNMMTAAALLGIDSCPIEGFNRKEVETLLTERGLLDPVHFGVSVMAGFGYRGEEPHRPKTRQALNEIVTFVR